MHFCKIFFENNTSFNHILRSDAFADYMNEHSDDLYNVYFSPWTGNPYIDIEYKRSIIGVSLAYAQSKKDILDAIKAGVDNPRIIRTIEDNLDAFMARQDSRSKIKEDSGHILFNSKQKEFRNELNSDDFLDYMNDHSCGLYEMFLGPRSADSNWRVPYMDILCTEDNIRISFAYVQDKESFINTVAAEIDSPRVCHIIRNNLSQYIARHMSLNEKKRKNVASFFLKRFGESHAYGTCPICGEELWTDEDVSENKNGKLCHTECLGEKDRKKKNDDDPPVCPVCKKYIFPNQRVCYPSKLKGKKVHVDCADYI